MRPAYCSVGGEAFGRRQFAKFAICHLAARMLVASVAPVPRLRIEARCMRLWVKRAGQGSGVGAAVPLGSGPRLMQCRNANLGQMALGGIDPAGRSAQCGGDDIVPCRC